MVEENQILDCENRSYGKTKPKIFVSNKFNWPNLLETRSAEGRSINWAGEIGFELNQSRLC